jgi:hypothetical protein
MTMIMIINSLPIGGLQWPITSSITLTYIREFKIYDAAGSATRSEFQLKSER